MGRQVQRGRAETEEPGQLRLGELSEKAWTPLSLGGPKHLNAGFCDIFFPLSSSFVHMWEHHLHVHVDVRGCHC